MAIDFIQLDINSKGIYLDFLCTVIFKIYQIKNSTQFSYLYFK